MSLETTRSGKFTFSSSIFWPLDLLHGEGDIALGCKTTTPAWNIQDAVLIRDSCSTVLHRDTEALATISGVKYYTLLPLV